LQKTNSEIMKEFWNERYASHTVAYGMEPNRFFKHFINNNKPGSILLPAEGEGRNAVYAASKGWEVDAFDFSEVARDKALRLAEEKCVHINYELSDIRKYKAVKQYDAVGLFYVHLPERVRIQFHKEVCKSLKSSGILVLEAFAKEQINNNSGGPKDISVLYDAPAICEDFQHLYLLFCGQKEILLSEGEFHNGHASVLRFAGQKL
jgi:2-polyprenyl-3-methyl-5-hydroxy-6-metoxy-1,4-benzoquinol methylase